MSVYENTFIKSDCFLCCFSITTTDTVWTSDLADFLESYQLILHPEEEQQVGMLFFSFLVTGGLSMLQSIW